MNAAIAVPLSLFQDAIAVSLGQQKKGKIYRPTPEDCDVSAHLLSHPELDLQVWLEGECKLNVTTPPKSDQPLNHEPNDHDHERSRL